LKTVEPLPDMSRTILMRMQERLRNWHFSRPQMLGIALFVIGADSLFFSVLVDLPYDARPNFWLGVILLAAIPLVRWRQAFAYLVNLMLGSGLFVITYLAIHSGGINSPTLVWIAVMPMLALLLMGRKTTFVWMGLTLIAYFSLYMACKSGWIASVNPHTTHDVWWAFLNHAFAAAGLIMGVQMYDYLHKQQMDLLDRRNGELMATHESMRQAQAHKDEFLAAVGHELRTPMNAILGFNGVLRDQVARDPEQVEIVDHIRRATQQLLGLVNDILDFSQPPGLRCAACVAPSGPRLCGPSPGQMPDLGFAHPCRLSCTGHAGCPEISTSRAQPAGQRLEVHGRGTGSTCAHHDVRCLAAGNPGHGQRHCQEPAATDLHPL
jgi:signal transduction histidine kinase